jgi:hypothetical protein
LNIAISDEQGSRMKVEIFNAQGNAIGMDQPARNGNQLTWNVEGLAPGAYFVRLSTADTIRLGRFVKE